MNQTELANHITGHLQEARQQRRLEHGRVERMVPQVPLTQAEVCRRLRQLVGTHGIERLILFGSFARGTQTAESDVDLILIIRSELRFLDRYPELLSLLHDTLRPHAVEPLIYTASEYEVLRARGMGIVHTADAEGVMIGV